MFKRNRISLSLLLVLSVSAGAMVAAELDTRRELDQRKLAAQLASDELLKKLGGTLKNEMASNGPEKAISVCRDLAPQIAGEISRKHGWRVTRISTKTRNPMLGMPDSWEISTLAGFETRRQKGEDLSEMSFAEVVEEGGVRYYRYARAIGTKPVCLTCHGNYEQIPGAIQMRLEQEYPLDRATGYSVGELRGAVSIKQPLDIPLPADLEPQ